MERSMRLVRIEMFRHVTPILACALALAACSPGWEWSHATSQNTISAYRQFLSKYPNDAHAADAHKRIAAFEDDKAWTQAQVISTVDGYHRYLTVEPNGAHAQVARENITSRERAYSWEVLEAGKETPAALEDFLEKFPTGAEADLARGKLAMLVGYRADLGSFSSRRGAERERARLARRFKKALPQVVILQPGPRDSEFRITSLPMSEQQANGVCAHVASAGSYCEVIQSAG
jgi:hypothetical protein